MQLLTMTLLPFAGSLLLSMLPRQARNPSAWLAGAVTLCALALLGAQAAAVSRGEVQRFAVAWLPSLGVDFGLRLDGLAFLFCLLILGIGAMIVLYARYYLSPEDSMPRFYAMLLLFMGAMLGVVTAGNLIMLVVFWEITSLSSFLLIGFWKHSQDARRGARMALTITGAGGLCLLGGALLMGHIVGSYDLDAVLAAKEQVQASPLYLPALVLVLLGAFTKSAQFPFHFWLPHAMAAPTPVSAYLHSATMVKAGVFLLARLYPVLSGTEAWFWLVSGAGLATLLVGAFIAIFKHDLKGLLAYSTISHLGLITLLFGLNSPLAAVAGVFHILNHATFKASLFMAAGIIDHECGTRDMRKLNGLWRYMPWTATLAMVAASAMAGVPLLNGFLSKEMFFAETLFVSGELAGRLIPVAATVAAVFSVTYSIRFVHDAFFNGEPKGLERTPHEPPRWMRVPVEVLVLICLAVGILPAWTVGPLLALGAQATIGGPLPEYSLAIWHGLNVPLLMSAIALLGGIGLYTFLYRRFDLHTVDDERRGGRDAFEYLVLRLTSLSRALTFGLQNGSLQRYLRLFVLAALLAGAWPFVHGQYGTGPLAGTAVSPVVLAVWGIGAVATVATVILHRSRFVALVTMGVAGLIVSLAFVWFSAPDLALTQLLVEVVSILLMMLALRFLPQESAPEPVRRRLADGAIAIFAGAGIAAIVYAVLTRPLTTISGYFLEKAQPEGGGTNVVNVILVDFRGYDTLGEISVLGIAGLVIHALLRQLRVPELPQPFGAQAADRHPLLLALIARLLLPLAAVVSMFLFMRGHNLPGGGFVAGLVLGVALLVQYVASGMDWTMARMRTDFHAWIGWGLVAAGFTGLAAWGFGYPFLTSSFVHPILPVIGEVPIASAMFFDLGVFLTVVGSVMVSLTSIARLRAGGAPHAQPR
ncbi:monovalent cation/H+ antiporter subunit A [Quisquiliibacterium transsilvanicum]|uniref:Multicomponent K+:H+ antiporter subunit A n=1 Tax=Quisquiliibacterium transsilvanicum TaxID=1549638 RepID=A0A7W8M748_9BURK|nr:monovalent cation/H+ antiporter subunit A [Quisquiliibacterium transsilvanicum]MBB5270358.1 multicomponent K+:H+ antiporter subunit A [Quisquiliibacterium transsilvanicum]